MFADGADVVVCWVQPGLLRTRRQQLGSDTEAGNRGRGGGWDGGGAGKKEGGVGGWVPGVGVGFVSFRLLNFQGQIFAVAYFELWQMELY